MILTFYKRLLGVKKTTQNDFVCGELGRRPLICNKYFIIIKFWFNILNCTEHKYINKVYNILLSDIENNNNVVNWASLLRDILCKLGFNHVC